MSLYAIVVFVVLWIGFACALGANREWLDILWSRLADLPPCTRIATWILILPIMVGLWVWESSWPVVLRLAAFGGLIAWTGIAVSGLVRAYR